MSKIDIGVIVGSLRRDSFSKKIAIEVSGMMPENFNMKYVDIGNLVLFNQDFDDDGNTPEEWIAFRAEIKALQGYLFVTPEYNRSFPPVLKNALDIASRPYGENVWSGKPGAIISVSPGRQGGFGANHHLRQIMMSLNIYMMQQPEVYLGNVTDVLDEKGEVTNEGTRGFLRNVTESYAQWISRFVD